jgi:hypothetical protein
MYGFCRIIDLGILHFYFSSKNCSSKVYTHLEKVVVLVTLSTAKLSLLFLDFSTICYGFYKVLPNTHKEVKMHFAKDTLERSEVSQQGPWFAQNTPETLEALQCSPWSLGRRGW